MAQLGEVSEWPMVQLLRSRGHLATQRKRLGSRPGSVGHCVASAGPESPFFGAGSMRRL
jgi:hypothetical protein